MQRSLSISCHAQKHPMPKRFLYFAIAIALISCRKEKSETPTDPPSQPINNSVPMQQHATWTAIPFKTDYTIQLPAEYQGIGMAGIEGNIFIKRRTDTTVTFKYGFCNSLRCNDFGATLKNPAPASVEYRNGNFAITLDKRLAFHNSDSQRVAILYYSGEQYAHGKLYWNENGVFKDALEIFYISARHQEVLDIIKTIKRK
jgi:hypothetical protein